MPWCGEGPSSACTALIIAFGLLAGSCAGTTREPSGGPTPSPSASPRQASSDAVRELPDTLTDLDPGRYTFASFRPRVTFRVTSGWQVGHRHSRLFDIWHGQFTGLAFVRPSFVIGRTGRIPTSGLRAHAFLDDLAANPGVTHAVVIPRVDVGGRSGPALDFRPLDGYAIFGTDEGAYHPGAALIRVIVLTFRGAIILVMETSVLPPDQQHLRTIRAVEQTVRFTP